MNPLIQSALEEFEKKFGLVAVNMEYEDERYYHSEYLTLDKETNDIKSFLSSKLLEIRNATIEEAKERVEDIKKHHVDWQDTELSEYATGGKETCEDILQALSSLQVKTE